MILPARRRTVIACALALATALVVAGCGSGSSASHGRIVAVGAENQYANVIEQVGGRYVSADAVESNPNTDPHTYQASPSVAQSIAEADLVVENGVGYDSFMSSLEAASPNAARKVINVQKLLGLPDSTPNPHLWYRPGTMSAVAAAIARDLSALQPKHAAYFRANAARFDASLRPWLSAIARLRSRYAGTPVATTEPVADYLIEAAGLKNVTPFSMQADIMNGTDPAPQDVGVQRSLFSDHRVRIFIHNRQVTSPLTESFVEEAKHDGIPIVGVYETMPTPGYDYQQWMEAETAAIERAIADHRSAERL